MIAVIIARKVKLYCETLLLYFITQLEAFERETPNDVLMLGRDLMLRCD